MHQAAALLQGAAREAVETLRAILSKAESEAARVSAARTILDMALKAADLEDVQRGEQRGRFYFARKRTFLFCLDTRMVGLANSIL